MVEWGREGEAGVYRVALVQFDAVPVKNQRNAGKIERLSREAAAKGAKIIMFHESSVTDYVGDTEKFGEYVPDGAVAKRIEKVAKELGVYISYGVSEKTHDRQYYITQVFTGPKGFIYKYRKTWVYKDLEDDGYRNEWARYDPGPGPELFDIAGLKAVCFICADGSSARCVERARLLKPDIIFYPNNRASYLGQRKDFAQNAATIGAPMLTTNRVGNSWVHSCRGGCSVIDSTGKFLAYTEPDRGEQILIYDLAVKERQRP